MGFHMLKRSALLRCACSFTCVISHGGHWALAAALGAQGCVPFLMDLAALCMGPPPAAAAMGSLRSEPS